VDEAVRIVDKTLIAAQQDSPLPDELPPNVISLFADWGRTQGMERDRLCQFPHHE